MGYKNASMLNRYMGKGDILRADDLNAISRAVSQDRLPQLGVADESGLAVVKSQYRRRWFPVSSLDNFAPYSAFTIRETGLGTETMGPFPEYPNVAIYDATTIEHARSAHNIILTNGPEQFTSTTENRLLFATVVDSFEPTLLRVSDVAQPARGQYAGLESGTGRITTAKYGLIALSGVIDNTLQWFVQSRGPIAVSGLVQTELTAANAGNFGFGTVRVINRIDGGATKSIALDSNDVGVWNPFAKSFAAGLPVVAVESPGIGLIVTGDAAPTGAVEECHDIGPFVTDIDFITCTATLKDLRVCVRWQDKTFSLALVDT